MIAYPVEYDNCFLTLMFKDEQAVNNKGKIRNYPDVNGGSDIEAIKSILKKVPGLKIVPPKSSLYFNGISFTTSGENPVEIFKREIIDKGLCYGWSGFDNISHVTYGGSYLPSFDVFSAVDVQAGNMKMKKTTRADTSEFHAGHDDNPEFHAGHDD